MALRPPLTVSCRVKVQVSYMSKLLVLDSFNRETYEDAEDKASVKALN